MISTQNPESRGLKLAEVVPWGRSYAEYVKMFNLSSDSLSLSILDCASGPASFNAEMYQRGYRVISCDPVYQFSQSQIEQRIRETYPIIVQGLRENLDRYVWKEITSPEHLGEVRMTAMKRFLADFPLGVQQGRYLTHALPNLPFESKQFNLALCSHFLWIYSDHLSADFHLASIIQMCRVADEVRIFPLLTLAGERSPWFDVIIDSLSQQGYNLTIEPVTYEFQQGGNQMLKVRCSN